MQKEASLWNPFGFGFDVNRDYSTCKTRWIQPRICMRSMFVIKVTVWHTYFARNRSQLIMACYIIGPSVELVNISTHIVCKFFEIIAPQDTNELRTDQTDFVLVIHDFCLHPSIEENHINVHTMPYHAAYCVLSARKMPFLHIDLIILLCSFYFSLAHSPSLPSSDWFVLKIYSNHVHCTHSDCTLYTVLCTYTHNQNNDKRKGIVKLKCFVRTV